MLGDLLEIVALFLFFTGLLQAWRTARPLGREPALFLGLALAAAPPAIELVRYLQRWHP